MSCARALSCAISSTDSCARALSRAISSTDSCARALSAGLGCSCCALRAERERAKRVTARLLPDWTLRKQSKREANCSPHRAPASFQEADRAKKAAKKSASKPCQMPTSSLCAALLLDERVQNFSDLDDRVASRLRASISSRVGSGCVVVASVAKHSWRAHIPARVAAQQAFRQ